MVMDGVCSFITETSEDIFIDLGKSHKGFFSLRPEFQTKGYINVVCEDALWRLMRFAWPG